jgi:hypothetical protein
MIMEKKQIAGELIDINSWAHDEDNYTFMIGAEAWLSNTEGTTELFLDIPYHQDFYEVLKDYCKNYEEFMLKKFAEK